VYGQVVGQDRPDEAGTAYQIAEREAAEALDHLRGVRDALRNSLGEMPPVWNTLVGLHQLDVTQIEASGLADRLREIREVVEEFRAEINWLEGMVEEWPNDFGL